MRMANKTNVNANKQTSPEVYLVALIISCLQYENFIWLPLVLYMILNKRDIFMMFNTAKKLIINPDIINI